MMRLARLALTTGAMVTFAGTASAAPAPERGTSEYHPAPGCPGEFTFRAQVQARTSGLVLMPAGAPDEPARALRFVVWLRQEGAGYAGTLEIWRDGAATRSTLQAPTCDEVVAGLSIAAALSAASAPAEAAPDRPGPVATAPRAADAPTREPSAAGPQSGWLLGANLGARFGYGPSASFTAGVLTGRWFAPGSSGLAWRAAANVALGKDVSSSRVPAIRLGFIWVGMSGDVCPLSVVAGTTSALLVCASMDLGLLSARASNGETSSRPWLAPGLVLRFSARFGAIFLEPQLAVKAPLIRDRYWFRPDTSAFEVPWVAGEAALSGGVAF